MAGMVVHFLSLRPPPSQPARQRLPGPGFTLSFSPSLWDRRVDRTQATSCQAPLLSPSNHLQTETLNPRPQGGWPGLPGHLSSRREVPTPLQGGQPGGRGGGLGEEKRDSGCNFPCVPGPQVPLRSCSSPADVSVLERPGALCGPWPA